MLVLDRILAIPDSDRDFVQMGISGQIHAALVERGGVRKDGTKAKTSVLNKSFVKGDKKLTENTSLTSDQARKIKGAIADQRSINSSGKRSGKSNTQKSDQAYQLHEKTKQSHEKARDKFIGLSDELGALRDQAQDAKGKVATGRNKKRASEMKDAFKFNNALEAEAMNNGQAVPVMRQKANKKQMASINDKINQKENEMFAAQSRTNQLKARANKLFDASQDYSNKSDTTPSKSRKVIKGKSPRDRGINKGFYIRDTLVSPNEFNALPKEQKQEILGLQKEFESLGYIDARTAIGPDQSRRMSDRQRTKNADTASRVFAIEDKVKEALKPSSQKTTEAKQKQIKSLQEQINFVNNEIRVQETFNATKINSKRNNLTKQGYQEMLKRKSELLVKLGNESKPATKPPSAIAKKLNLTAAKEAEILKSIKRF